MPEKKLDTKQCPKCKEDIPKDAKKCKHCGAPVGSWFGRHKIITIIFVLVVFFLIKSLVTPNNPDSNGGNNGLNSTNSDSQLSEEQKDLHEKISEIQIVSSTVTPNGIGTPILELIIKNNSKNTVDALDFEAWLYNNYDEPVGEWNIAKNKPFRDIIQEKIAPGASGTFTFNLAVYDQATKAEDVTITKVHFTNGETLSIE